MSVTIASSFTWWVSKELCYPDQSDDQQKKSRSCQSVMNTTAKHNNKKPLVSVVVVAYKGLELTRQCLHAITQQTYENLELIFVDNGSVEPVGDMITNEFPKVKLLSLKRNTGFAGGHNQGILASAGKYVAIINNDAMASPDWVEVMVKAAEADEQLGSVASMIVDG